MQCTPLREREHMVTLLSRVIPYYCICTTQRDLCNPHIFLAENIAVQIFTLCYNYVWGAKMPSSHGCLHHGSNQYINTLGIIEIL